MEIIQAENIVGYDGTVIALGNFDGLHTAHMQIIRHGIEIAKSRNLKSGVLLFEENTKTVAGKRETKLITPHIVKLELLERENADFVYVRKFTREFMKLSPEEFAQLLVKNTRARVVCVGYDYRFGYKALGDVEMLAKLGKKYGFEVAVTDKITIDGVTVSSTYIRELIAKGEIQRANKFLNRRYCIEGTVVRGLQNGRKMGLPTANVDYDKDMALPLEGVYAGNTHVGGEKYKSVVNVGKNLTFGADKITVESHLIDFDGDIYGEKIRICFEDRLRGVIKFENPQQLRNQINSDILTARNMDF